MLRRGSATDITQMFARMRRNTELLVKDVIQLVYFMRGSIQYHDMMFMTYVERQLVSEFIKERLERERDKPNPIY